MTHKHIWSKNKWKKNKRKTKTYMAWHKPSLNQFEHTISAFQYHSRVWHQTDPLQHDLTQQGKYHHYSQRCWKMPCFMNIKNKPLHRSLLQINRWSHLHEFPMLMSSGTKISALGQELNFHPEQFNQSIFVFKKNSNRRLNNLSNKNFTL